MKEIPLTQGKVALVDDEDYNRVIQFKWRCSDRGTSFYAMRTIDSPLGNGYTTQLLHHFILGSNKRVDHKDRNGLNCQKSNLRHATASQNAQNQVRYTRAKSGFKGVYPLRGKKEGLYRASITADKVTYDLGEFESVIDAALAYDEAAKKYHGDYAQLNFSM